MKDKENQIEEIVKIEIGAILEKVNMGDGYADINSLADQIYHIVLPEDSVVLSREEYEKLKSLYDSQQGAIMTSSIGDLPLTVEGLRKAVDEIARLIGVQTELQELNAKYYNEAKDLRRELEKEQINNLNCDTELQYKEKRIAELEKENARLLNSVETVQSNRCTTKCELTKKELKQFVERLKECAGQSYVSQNGKRISDITYSISDSTTNKILKELLCGK